ncbi:MAG: hypothetical protein HGB08_01645 [Candidatus Moranbacteria bacterium]|nr:hypothetical protein [Candidatus Moranbacteria bacterium]
MLLTVVVFLVMLGLLIFVHELGHFVVAKRNGIEASEFGFGFPPRMIGLQFLQAGKDGKKGKWRIIWGGRDGNNENEKKDLAKAHENNMRGGTIYSLNWIPLGGFVRIKGEDGGFSADKDSFASKSAWIRIKVLAAGVTMNFVLAWIIISIGLMIGDPQPVDMGRADTGNSIIQIDAVTPGAPAEAMGLMVGDIIVKDQPSRNGQALVFKTTEDIQNYVNANKGQEISIEIKRGNSLMTVSGIPRENPPEGQGALGIQFSQNVFVKYPWHIALWEGLLTTISLVKIILVAFFAILGNLFMGHGTGGVELAGPVKIGMYTKQATEMGLIYVLHLAALLSINLGIINILPIPALDGGRIFFILIEKLKGKSLNKSVEQMIHTAFFIVLVSLMLFVTFKEVFELLSKRL